MISLDATPVVPYSDRSRFHHCYGPLCARCSGSGIVSPAHWLAGPSDEALCHAHFVNHLLAEALITFRVPAAMLYEAENQQDPSEASGCYPDDFCESKNQRRRGRRGIRGGATPSPTGDKTSSAD